MEFWCLVEEYCVVESASLAGNESVTVCQTRMWRHNKLCIVDKRCYSDRFFLCSNSLSSVKVKCTGAKKIMYDHLPNYTTSFNDAKTYALCNTWFCVIYFCGISYVPVSERYPATAQWPSKFLHLGKTLSSTLEVSRTKSFIHVIITISVGVLYDEVNKFIRVKQFIQS